VGGEAGLGLFYVYWLYIGVSQCVYLAPGIAVALLRKRPALASGLLRGGGIIAVANVPPGGWASTWACGEDEHACCAGCSRSYRRVRLPASLLGRKCAAPPDTAPRDAGSTPWSRGH
jgi:hypothetical protein